MGITIYVIFTEMLLISMLIAFNFQSCMQLCIRCEVNKVRIKKIVSLGFVIVLAVVINQNQTAFAATFNVSNTAELRQALLDATGNGQSDVIVLVDGTYKTTDDAGGTFTFLDNEAYDLTLQGSSAENVVLSGDNIDQVLNFNIINGTPTIYLTNISIINGKSTNGGGIYSAAKLEIKNCIISGNTASSDGGGFYVYANSASITNSTISGNTGRTEGGGFFVHRNATIVNSTISGNTGNYGGGFNTYNTTITNSTISDNTGSYGGGFYTCNATITNSTISGNNAGNNGGGFVALRNVTITNSIIINNTALTGNGIYLEMDTDHKILNSIFINNGSDEIFGITGVVATIHNCYIDESKILVTSLKVNNIFGGDLDFIDQANNNYHIGAKSVLIDAGTTDVTGITYPTTDFDGNARIVGTTIDIGPYEYQSITRPTINSFSCTGTKKIEDKLIFSIDATPSEGRSLSLYEIDYGDGNFITASSSVTHTYSTPGNYTVRVKVTDNEGESSISTLTLFIADLTVDEKIAKAYQEGQQYVQDNLTAFGLTTLAEKDRAVSDAIKKYDIGNDGKIGIKEAINALQVITKQ